MGESFSHPSNEFDSPHHVPVLLDGAVQSRGTLFVLPQMLVNGKTSYVPWHWLQDGDWLGSCPHLFALSDACVPSSE